MQALKKGAAQSGSPTTPTQDGQGEKFVKSSYGGQEMAVMVSL